MRKKTVSWILNHWFYLFCYCEVKFENYFHLIFSLFSAFFKAHCNNYTRIRRGEIKFDSDALEQKCLKIGLWSSQFLNWQFRKELKSSSYEDRVRIQTLPLLFMQLEASKIFIWYVEQSFEYTFNMLIDSLSMARN